MPPIKQGRVVTPTISPASFVERPVMVVEVSRRALPLGETVITAGVVQLLWGTTIAMELLERHRRGDWGDLNDDEKRENESAVANSTRLGYMSVYNLPQGTIWIITDYGREVTTVLLPEER